MTEFVEIVDRHGRRRPARRGEVLADGERFSLPMTFMDAHLRDALLEKYRGGDAAIRIVDAAGRAPGHRPGCWLHHATALADAAAEAYEQMRTRLADGWRKGRPDPVRDQTSRQLTCDVLRAAVEQAREDRNERMRNAWRR